MTAGYRALAAANARLRTLDGELTSRVADLDRTEAALAAAVCSPSGVGVRSVPRSSVCDPPTPPSTNGDPHG